MADAKKAKKKKGGTKETKDTEMMMKKADMPMKGSMSGKKKRGR